VDHSEADRQNRIEQLKSDIDSQENTAETWEKTARDMANNNNNNCAASGSGLGGLFCRGIGTAGIAKAKKEAVKARNQIAADQEEIERLQGLEVQHRARRNASYGGNLAQAMQDNPGPTIQETAAQQQANLAATAAAQQQRQQQQQAQLENFEATMRRWRWDADTLHNPIRWQITQEREIQDILWLILRSYFPDIVDEDTLPKLGIRHTAPTLASAL